MNALLDSLWAQIDGFTLTLVVLAFVVCLIFAPTRAVIGFCFKIAVDSAGKILGIAFTGLHEGLSKLFDAHMTYFKNWMPRASVLPSVRNDRGTRRV